MTDTALAAKHLLGYYKMDGGITPAEATVKLIHRWNHASPIEKMNLAEEFPAMAHIISIKGLLGFEGVIDYVKRNPR